MTEPFDLHDVTSESPCRFSSASIKARLTPYVTSKSTDNTTATTVAGLKFPLVLLTEVSFDDVKAFLHVISQLMNPKTSDRPTTCG